jgi:hypothetical protein
VSRWSLVLQNESGCQGTYSTASDVRFAPKADELPDISPCPGESIHQYLIFSGLAAHSLNAT